MSAAKVHVLENLARTVAIWSSAVSAVIFAIGFATDGPLFYSWYHSWNLEMSYPRVMLFFVLLTALFSAYLIAGKRKWELSGSLLALAIIAGTYGWCELGMQGDLGPYFMVLAFPAVCHVFAVLLPRLTLPAVQETPVEVPPAELVPSAA